jgi:hypothetical protein
MTKTGAQGVHVDVLQHNGTFASAKRDERPIRGRYKAARELRQE